MTAGKEEEGRDYSASIGTADARLDHGRGEREITHINGNHLISQSSVQCHIAYSFLIIRYLRLIFHLCLKRYNPTSYRIKP